MGVMIITNHQTHLYPFLSWLLYSSYSSYHKCVARLSRSLLSYILVNMIMREIVLNLDLSAIKVVLNHLYSDPLYESLCTSDTSLPAGCQVPLDISLSLCEKNSDKLREVTMQSRKAYVCKDL